MEQSSIYTYKKVKELTNELVKINIFGIIKYFRPPTKTKIGQYSALYTIIDPSVGDNLEQGIRCNLFHAEEEKLPQVQNVGDVIRLHRVNVKTFNDRLQVQATKGMSWIVYDSKNFNEKKFKSSHPNPTITEKDSKHAQTLHSWMKSIEDHLVEKPKIIANTVLNNIKIDSYFNCLVRVVDIYHFTDHPNYCLLKVSDGSEVKYNSLRQAGIIENESEDAQALTACSFDIAIFDDHVTDVKSLHIGDFVIIVNVHAKSVWPHIVAKCKQDLSLTQIAGITDWVELVLHTGKHLGRGIKKIEKTFECQSIENKINYNITKYKKVLTDNEVNKDESLTVIEFPWRSIDTIDWLKHQSIPAKARLKVKVFTIMPPNIQECIFCKCKNCGYKTKLYNAKSSLICIDNNNWMLNCQQCKKPTVELVYLFVLLVEDDTGILQVIIAEEDALLFFNNISPKTLLVDTQQKQNMQEKLHQLVTGHFDINERDISSLPFVDMCVYSFSTSDGISYRMFGTSLK